MVEGTGEVIWADNEGRAGMLFSHLSAASRKFLKKLAEQANRTAASSTRHSPCEKSYPSSLTAH